MVCFNNFQIDLMHDRNAEVQKLCDTTLDIISLHDDAWRDRVSWHVLVKIKLNYIFYYHKNQNLVLKTRS